MNSTSEKTLTPDEHSSLVGGSTAARRIACPGSYRLEQLVPIHEEEESSYAKEGTALHEAMARILTEDIIADEVPEKIIGQTFYGVEITQELADEMIYPCLDFLDALFELCERDGGELVFEVEQRYEMPGVPGAFGTSDFVGRAKDRSILIDWKFGRGKAVPAAYPDPSFNGPADQAPMIANKQLSFYAVAASAARPELFEQDDDWRVELFIVQPGIAEERGGVKRHTTTVGHLQDFHIELLDAIDLCKTPDAPVATKPGGYCDWCQCKTVCPTHTGALLDLSKLYSADTLSKLQAGAEANDGGVEYEKLLATIMDLGAIVGSLVKDAHKQAHQMLEAGVAIPGYTLKPKRAGAASWAGDFKQIDSLLARKGLGIDARRDISNITPAKAREAVEFTDREANKWIAPGVSSGSKVARAADAGTPTDAAEVAAKLSKLLG